MDMKFTKEAWDKLKSYFEAAYQQLGDLELQGYGRVRMEDGKPVCYEIGIPEQKVSAMKTDATWDQMLAFLQERVDFRDTKKARREVPTWRLWWHTHGKGGFSPMYSGTDEDTVKALAAEAGDHMWGLVFHSDTMDSTLYLATRYPVPLYATLGKAICEMEAVDVSDAIGNEVAAKVSKDQTFISLIERSQRRVDVLEFIALARAMGEDPQRLFAEVIATIPTSFKI